MQIRKQAGLRNTTNNWKGEGYEAIALIDAFDEENTQLDNRTALEEKREDDGEGLSVIDKGENIFSATEKVLATRQQVKKAHALVKEYTDAIAAAQFYFAPDESKKKMNKNGEEELNEVGRLSNRSELSYFETKLTSKKKSSSERFDLPTIPTTKATRHPISFY